MSIYKIVFTSFLSCWFLAGCSTDGLETTIKVESPNNSANASNCVGPGDVSATADTITYNRKSRIADVIADPVFDSYGQLLFPVQRGYWSGETLEQLRLTYYNYIDPDETVAIVNYLHNQAAAGKQFSIAFIQMKRKPPTCGSEIRACSSSVATVEHALPYAMPEEPLPMWGQCTTVFLMPWNYPRKAIMPLLSSRCSNGM